MISKANLAPGDHASAMPRQIHQTLLCRIVVQLRIMGMNTDDRKDLGMLFSQLNRALEHATMRIARAHIEHGCDAGITRSCDYLCAIGIVFRTIYVAM